MRFGNRIGDPGYITPIISVRLVNSPWGRYKLALSDLPEMFLIRGVVFSHEAACNRGPSSPRGWLKSSGTPTLQAGCSRYLTEI